MAYKIDLYGLCHPRSLGLVDGESCVTSQEGGEWDLGIYPLSLFPTGFFP